jgi:3-oxoacyl-[acyl-carrier protein] reductase
VSAPAESVRHVLVTGAASGIGAAVCRQFALMGHRITGVDLRAGALAEVSEEIGETSQMPMGQLVGDLADESFAERVAPDVWNRFGAVDIVVTAAGIYPAIAFLQYTSQTWDHVQAVNVRSAMQITRSLAELAIAHGRTVVVVHVSSGAAQRARPGAAAYSASKAALEMLTRSAALELGPFGIRVNAVSPGFVDVGSVVNPVTEAYAAALSINPLGRRGKPEDIANAVLWLASDEAAWVTGTVLRVDGGASAGTTTLPFHWSGQTALQSVVGRNGANTDEQ